MTLRCDQCDAPAAVVEPGAEASTSCSCLKREAPMRCWCLARWVAAFRVPVDEAAA